MSATTKQSVIDSDALLDRSEQLTELARCWDAVRVRESGRLVLVSGEAGAGKTAMLRRFWAQLDSSTRVLWAACEPLSTPRPLGPLLDIGRVIEGSLREQLDNGGQPYDVADALITELDSYATPAVLVVEDVQWADDATLDVVRILARRVELLPALLLFSFREEELGRFHPLRALLGDIGGPKHVTRLDVPALTRAGVAELAKGSGVDVDELFALTSGNAFFVTETLAAHTDGLPATVRDAVLARAGRLGPGARALLDAAAIVPHSVEQWLLDAVCEAPAAVLEDCVSAGMLIFESDRVAFRHELARLTIEESIAPDARLKLHRRALKALTDAPRGAGALARLAYHAEVAADTVAVLAFAPAAAHEAASVGAHTEAQAQYGRALRFAGGVEPQRRAELLEGFAEEGYLTDMRVGALEAISEAVTMREAIGDAVGQAKDLRKREGLLGCMGRAREARVDSEAAVRILEREAPGPDLASAWGGLCYSLMREARVEEGRSLGERALALAERLGDRDALATVLNDFGTQQLLSGDEEGRAMLERSLALSLEAGDGPGAGVTYINLSEGLGTWRRWLLADQYLEEGIAFCRARGLDAWEQCLLANRMHSELAKGFWDAVPSTGDEILAGSPDWHVEPRQAAARALGLLRARRGDPGCWEPLDEALAMARSGAEPTAIADVACARAEARWLEGDNRGVGAETDEVFALALEHKRQPYAGELACWRRRAGLPFEALSHGLQQHRLQLAGRGERAADIWTHEGCAYDAALALFDSERIAAWHEALELLTTLGARPAAARVARKLREAGERGLRRGPRRQTKQNPVGLTGRQLEVLGLLARGMRNAEIAERLVLSRKTVDHHVSAILGKLDVKSRGEASAKAIKLGIVAPGEQEVAPNA